MIARFRGKEPGNMCEIVFEQPDKNKPVLYRLYVNEKYYTTIKNPDVLFYFVDSVKKRIPDIEIYYRPTRKHYISFEVQQSIMRNLESDLCMLDFVSKMKRGNGSIYDPL